jgi:membrane-associated protease RseP (regulator of RpoE activity)
VPRRDTTVTHRWLAVGLLVATAASVVGMHRWNAGSVDSARGWLESVVFCAVLLGILGAHELGHHTLGRRHGLRLSMPLFLPAPFFVGTLGAILAVRDRPRSRTALLEMGAAGPIAGFAVIAAVVALRMLLGGAHPGGEPLSRPLVWSVLGWLVAGEVPSLTTADPVGYAAWVGCLVTAMNLLPFGQLDGGHVACALWPRASVLRWGVTALLGVMGAWWPGWWAWLAAIWLLASRRAWAVEGPAPTRRARWTAAIAAAVLASCFTPIPW